MHKNKKILLAIIFAILLGLISIFVANPEYFQGAIRRFDSASLKQGINYEDKSRITGYEESIKIENIKIKGAHENDCDQKSFKMAFILLVEDENNIPQDFIDKANYYRVQTSSAFSIATDNLATIDSSDPLFVMEIENAMFNEYSQLAFPEVITNNFYITNPDIYDFILIFPTFNYDNAPPSYTSVTRNIDGIGLPLEYRAGIFGSDGELKGLILLYNEWYIMPIDVPSISAITLNLILHEIGHYWGVWVGDDRDVLGIIKRSNSYEGLEYDFSVKRNVLGIRKGAHFYGGLESPHNSGSPLYSHKFVSNNDGTFREENTFEIKKYHPFMLYFMGLLPESEYGTKYRIFNIGANGENMHNAIPYYKEAVSVNDIIAVEGERKCNS